MIKYSIICNRCGKEFSNEIHEERNSNFKFDFGYESLKLDSQHISFDLCPECLDIILESMVKEFKIPPDGWYKDGYVNFSDKEYMASWKYWKETGEWNNLCGCTYKRLVDLNGIYDTEILNAEIVRRFPDKPLLERYKYDREDQVFTCTFDE